MHCPGCSNILNKKTRFCIHCGFDLSSMPGFFDSRMLPAGHLLDKRYRIIDYMTSGGMANIYRVEDSRLRTVYALKEMIDNFRLPEEREDAIHRFGREAEILARLKHPSIPRVIDHFVENDRYYLVMDYIEGMDLESALEKEPGGKFTQETVQLWLHQIMDVLKYLHSYDPVIIYRDLKPSNILLGKDGKIYLIDFGIARIFMPQKKGTLIGTPGYAPPEQYKGQMDVRSDIYALGATLHHLLTGKDPREDIPFSFPPVKELTPEIEDQFASVIDKALTYSVHARFSGINEMEKALEEISRRDEGREWFDRGCGLMKEGNHKEAEEAFTNALKLDPLDINILINRGAALEKQGKTDEAINDFKRAHSLDHKNTDVLHNLGCAMKKLGQLDKAEYYFNEVITLDQQRHDTYNDLGNLFYIREDWDKTIELYEKALSLESDSDLYRNNLNKARKRKSEHRQKARFDQAVQFESDPVRAYYNLGMHFVVWNRLDQAEVEFRKALRFAPDDPDPHEGLGLLYYKKKEYENAVNSLRKVLSIEPDRVNLYRPLGLSYSRLGRKNKALTCFQIGMETIRKNDDAWRRNNEFHLLSFELEKISGRKFNISQWEKEYLKSDRNTTGKLKNMLASLIDGTLFLSLKKEDKKETII